MGLETTYIQTFFLNKHSILHCYWLYFSHHVWVPRMLMIVREKSIFHNFEFCMWKISELNRIWAQSLGFVISWAYIRPISFSPFFFSLEGKDGYQSSLQTLHFSSGSNELFIQQRMPDTGPKSFVVAYKMWMGRPSPHREKESTTVRPNPLSASKLPINCMFMTTLVYPFKIGSI